MLEVNNGEEEIYVGEFFSFDLICLMAFGIREKTWRSSFDVTFPSLTSRWIDT